MEESDHCDVFSENEKEEFIFRIFKHLCLGGDICQVNQITHNNGMDNTATAELYMKLLMERLLSESVFYLKVRDYSVCFVYELNVQ